MAVLCFLFQIYNAMMRCKNQKKMYKEKRSANLKKNTGQMNFCRHVIKPQLEGNKEKYIK